MNEETTPELLERIGARVRKRRLELEFTLKDLSAHSGLSRRFISDIEFGRGNVSVGRLHDLAGALDVPLASLARPAATVGSRQAIDSLLDQSSEEEMRRLLDLMEIALDKRVPKVVALLGIRGAGKSTVADALGKTLQIPVVELVQKVEERAGMPLADVFAFHDESYYRRLELRCLADLLAAAQPCVAALPGGIIEKNEALQLIKDGCYSVWLRAHTQDYWRRVYAQGDTRPMEGRPDAMAALEQLVQRRAPLYRQANLIVDTHEANVDQIVATILADLDSSRYRS